MRRVVLTLAALAIAVAPASAAEKKKTKGKPATAASTQLTEVDIRTCMGLANDSTPKKQIAACTKIISSKRVKQPFEGDYYATRGAAYFALNDLDHALADLNKAVSIRQAPEFYMQRGMVLSARLQWDEAKADLDKVIAMKPDLPAAHLIRGVLSYRTGDYKDALGFFEASVQRSPTFYKGIFARGVAKKKLGDTSGGDADIAKAREMFPKVDQDFAGFGMKP